MPAMSSPAPMTSKAGLFFRTVLDSVWAFVVSGVAFSFFISFLLGHLGYCYEYPRFFFFFKCMKKVA